MSEKNKLTGPVRDKPPCGGCTEKFDTCHGKGKCPKDKRGERGYQAFLDQIAQVKAEQRKYDMKYNPHFHDYKEENHETK